MDMVCDATVWQIGVRWLGRCGAVPEARGWLRQARPPAGSMPQRVPAAEQPPASALPGAPGSRDNGIQRQVQVTNPHQLYLRPARGCPLKRGLQRGAAGGRGPEGATDAYNSYRPRHGASLASVPGEVRRHPRGRFC